MDVLVEKANELLQRGETLVLATIITQSGSTPRTAGTRMLITRDGQIFGTVGGGALEASTMRAAAEIHRGASWRILTFDLSNPEAAAMEMICGGRVEVLLDRIRPTAENRSVFALWHRELCRGAKALLVASARGAAGGAQELDHGLLSAAGLQQGRCDLSPPALERLRRMAAGASSIEVLTIDGALVLADPGQASQRLYVFGAGHVARPTAHLAALVGFGVTVLDDRCEFANAERFPDVRAVRTVASFDTALRDLPVDAGSYLVIVTRGHLHDAVVLAQALKTPAAYIGMIGSRRKRDAIYERLLREGFTTADLARVHCPIGLSIGAGSPEEIAVSIVAELIAVRAGVAPQACAPRPAATLGHGA
jgi:xanthine dehydrogenase accessory factor